MVEITLKDRVNPKGRELSGFSFFVSGTVSHFLAITRKLSRFLAISRKLSCVLAITRKVSCFLVITRKFGLSLVGKFFT